MQAPQPAGTHPAIDFEAVVPDDDESGSYIGPFPRTLYVGVSGDVVAVSLTGNTATFKDYAVGEHPIMFRRIMSTGTTATNMVALF